MRPSMRQRDFSMKRVAKLRDLKKRACHSHLSSRIAPQALTRRLLLSAELQLEQLGERRIGSGVALLLGRGIEPEGGTATVATRRPRSAAIFSRPAAGRTVVAP